MQPTSTSRSRRRFVRPLIAAQAALVMLMMVALACTSNDSLFIKLTITPVPTQTLTPLPDDFQSKFTKGDIAFIAHVSEFGGTEVYRIPNNQDRTQAVVGQCISGTKVSILDVAVSQIATDDTVFYSVDCGSGTRGWLAEYNLTKFAKNTSVLIKSSNGEGAPVFKSSDGKDVSGGDNCKDGTKVRVQKVILQQAREAQRGKIYFQIKCGTPKNVWVTEDFLAPQP